MIELWQFFEKYHTFCLICYHFFTQFTKDYKSFTLLQLLTKVLTIEALENRFLAL